jgi:hypothetical protein
MTGADTMKSRELEEGDTNPTDWTRDSGVFADIVARAMERAVEQAIAEHHRAGFAVPISRNGQVEWLHPDGSIRPDEEPEAEVETSES